jgi:hypothetical protein
MAEERGRLARAAMFGPAHPICLVAADADVLLRAVDPAGCIRTVASLDDVHAELTALAGSEPPGTRALDLIGHSTRDHHFLRIGDQAIDMTRPPIARLFDTIRREALLQQLGVIAVRLLGCSTALLPTGQRTLRRLARTLGVPVYGSTKPLMHSHYTADGFNPRFEHVLVEASQLPDPPRRLSPS